MKALLSWPCKHLLISAILCFILSLSLTLAACSGIGSSDSSGNAGVSPGKGTGSVVSPTAMATTTANSTATADTGGNGNTPSGSPGNALPCPASVQAPSHWDAILQTQQAMSKVESVTCGNLTGDSSLQALVTVRHAGTGAVLDVDIYSNIIDPAPTKLFALSNLYKGDARISGHNTIITAEVDQKSSMNINKDNASLTQDLFREFQWTGSKFNQLAFPGFFPDLTRFQAEDDQVQVDQGHQPWKLDAAMTANALAVNLLKWSTSAITTVESGGGSHDTNALVSVKSTNPGGGTIRVSLHRLEDKANGIWEAMAVQADRVFVDVPSILNGISPTLTSPVTVMGNGTVSGGKIGTITILDHLYTDIGHADIVEGNGSGNTSFSTPVTYTSTFHNDNGSQAEEGIVGVYSYSNADNSIATAVMIKVLLG